MNYNNKTIIKIWIVILFLFAGLLICDSFLYPSVTKKAGLQLISTYQKSISPILSKTDLVHCKYEVTCSEYTKQMIIRYNLLKGSIMGFKRILSCK